MQKADKILRVSIGGSKRRDDSHLSQAKSCGRHASPQCCQVILVAMADLLDQPMGPQAFEQLRDLPAGFLQPLRQVLVLKTGDVKLSAHQRLEHIQIIAGKQVKASQRTIPFPNRPSNLLHVFERLPGLIPWASFSALSWRS
jgi:hypothetical protein